MFLRCLLDALCIAYQPVSFSSFYEFAVSELPEWKVRDEAGCKKTVLVKLKF